MTIVGLPCREAGDRKGAAPNRRYTGASGDVANVYQKEKQTLKNPRDPREREHMGDPMGENPDGGRKHRQRAKAHDVTAGVTRPVVTKCNGRSLSGHKV
jgi:hypothetical protein